MSNPFENPNGTYFVLINNEGQYSIWPAFLDIPSGWTTIYGEESQKLCLDYINSNWVDMRPNSLKSEISIGKET
ncbi:MbtH family protein [Clostridium sp. SHJSY1]|uniref:MbtH family protein n=1 Tax=Clostridium sp. SHJSY1 TaxID=2942483 RepID=UPI002874891C|nr:MbtH family protein [Clostridium sp. SHJSY1]MDS0527392.1 MbtH family protein [Clostridium sp. SHJSY1]